MSLDESKDALPELADIYLIGFVACWIVSGIHLYLIHQRKSSQKTLLVQKNLKKIGKFFSENSATIEDYFEGCYKSDHKKALFSILIFSIIFGFLSWFGFIFNLIYIISLLWLAKPRLEKQLYQCPLAEKELDAESIEKHYLSLSNL
jgi:hypothetical protein